MSLVKKFEKNARETIIGRGVLPMHGACNLQESCRAGRAEFADAVRFTNYFLPPSQRIQFLALDYSALVGVAVPCCVLLCSTRRRTSPAVENKIALSSAPRRRILGRCEYGVFL
jgi:hypothetical protein